MLFRVLFLKGYYFNLFFVHIINCVTELLCKEYDFLEQFYAKYQKIKKKTHFSIF